MTSGYLMIVLHAHLPFIRHPQYEEFMEERWLFEAMMETYIPILQVFENLRRDNIGFNITMSLTPPLLEMLADDVLQQKFRRYLNKLIELSEKEVSYTRDTPFNPVATYYEKQLKREKKIYERYNRNLINGFKKFAEMGNLELITCAATHGILPFMKTYPGSVKAQLKVGIQTHKRHLELIPKGMWLPECAYFTGLDRYLKDMNVEYSFLDTHGIVYGEPRPRYSVYAPVITPGEVVFFGRDPESSEQVWSATIGYPGDFNYREFYRDIGFDRPYEYIKDYIDRSGERTNTGIKYYRITGKVPLGNKEIYDPQKAVEIAHCHANDFVYKKESQVKNLSQRMNDIPPVIVAPYDAELYGHWWYEGPTFLEFVLRNVNESNVIKTITPSQYLSKISRIQIVEVSPSTWGANGYYEVWLNGSNDWIYPHLHVLEKRMEELASSYKKATNTQKRQLNQMGRELLLAQSSDWAFIMTTGTTTEYARRRTRMHINRFLKLNDDIVRGNYDPEWLREVAWEDNIFPDLDYRVFRK